MRFFGATFFLFTTLLVALPFKESLAFEVFRATDLCATARLAFGRAGLETVARLLAADFGAELRVTPRDDERLKPLVTALISKVIRERANCGPSTPEVTVAE